MAGFDDFLRAAKRAADEYDLEVSLVHFSTAEGLLEAIKDPEERKEKRLDLLKERSKVLIVESEWDEALVDLEEAIPLAQELGKLEIVVDSMLGKGRIFLSRGNLQEAKRIFQEGFDIATEQDFEEKYPECHYFLGSTLAKMGEGDKALMIFESGLRIADRVEAEADIIAGIHIEMGLLHFRMGMMDDAAEFYQQCLEILEHEELNLKKANAYRYLGVIYSIKRDFMKCLQNYQNALRVFSELNNLLGLAKTYRSVGQAFMAMGFLPETIFFLERSRDIYDEIGAKSDLGMIYGKLGDAWIEREDYDKAIEYYMKDMEISEELNNTHALAYTYRNLGKIYRIKKDWENADKYYEKSYQYFSSVQDQLNTASTFLELAFLHTEMKDPDKALDYAKTAEQIFKENQKRNKLALVEVAYGIYNRLKRNWEEALFHFEKAITILSEGKPTLDLSDAFYHYAYTYREKREYDQALNFFKRALQIAEGLKASRQIDKCLKQITQIDELEVIRIALQKLETKELTKGYIGG